MFKQQVYDHKSAAQSRMGPVCCFVETIVFMHVVNVELIPDRSPSVGQTRAPSTEVRLQAQPPEGEMCFKQSSICSQERKALK